MTGYDTVAIRRTIYLTIMSSLDYEEVCHKLLKNTLKPGMEVCIDARLNTYVVFGRSASFAAQIRLGDCATYSQIPSDHDVTIRMHVACLEERLPCCRTI
jgi:uncharacterized protein with PIN domain